MQNVMKLVLHGKFLSSWDIVNVFYYGTGDLAALPTDAEALAVLTAFKTAWYDKVIVFNPAYTLMNVSEERWIWDGENFRAGYWLQGATLPVNRQGETGLDSLPTQMAAVLLGYTGIKKMMGKKFFGVLSEADQAGGVLVSTGITNMLQLLTVYLANITITSPTAAVWHPGVTGKGAYFAPFIGGSLNTVLGTQRRRKIGVGS